MYKLSGVQSLVLLEFFFMCDCHWSLFCLVLVHFYHYLAHDLWTMCRLLLIHNKAYLHSNTTLDIVIGMQLFVYINITLRYSEVCKPGYKFGTDYDQTGVGHFTQVCSYFKIIFYLFCLFPWIWKVIFSIILNFSLATFKSIIYSMHKAGWSRGLFLTSFVTLQA